MNVPRGLGSSMCENIYLSFLGMRIFSLAFEATAALGHPFAEMSAGRDGLGAAAAQASPSGIAVGLRRAAPGACANPP